MSVLDTLPDDVHAAIAVRKPGTRDDLLAIPQAEADGWIVTFKHASWHNPASFTKVDVTVYMIRLGWNRVRLDYKGRYTNPKAFKTLAAALEAETP